MSHLLSRLVRALAVPLALSALLAGPAGADSPRVPERQRPAFPAIVLAAKQSAGQEAIDRLGAALPAVAAWYGKSPDALRRQLLTDRRLRVDGKGRLFFVDEIDSPVQGMAAGDTLKVLDGSLSPLDQTFLLHSRPGANLTIYLDFDGATLTGTAWNSSVDPIYAPAFDLDGNSGSFSDAEKQRIQYIWQRVAEDYAPFDVDVTTEPPGYDQLHRTDSSDPVFGTTVLITTMASAYPNCNCGGVAYVGAFNDTTDTYKPALVFYDMLLSGDEKDVAEAISHEAGHNMGLHHDGTSTTGYYGGKTIDSTTGWGWAPIMGVGYYQPLVQFSKGEYSGANNKEDDFVIAQSNGLALRSDDYGSTIATATPFESTTSGALASGTMDGVIETAADADIFVVNSGPGTLTAAVSPAGRSPNADLVLTVLDSNGTVVATNNPLNAAGAALTYQVPAQGTYYIQVKGTGQGDPTTSGYSNYGSVGNYRLTASYTAPGGIPPTPVLSVSPTSGTAPLAVTIDGRGSKDADGIKFYYWDFGDGTTDNGGTLTNTTKTYSTAGTYTVRLTVVDNTGLSASTSQTVTVSAPVVQKTASVKSITMSISTSRTGYATATGVVTVVNQAGQTLSGASVAATWSGIVSRSSTATTSSTGRASFSSPSTKSTGCFKLTVTKITLTGYTFTSTAAATNQICR